MPTYLCHGFRWSRRNIRVYVIIQDLGEVAPDWVIKPGSSQRLLESFYTLFDFLPACEPTRNEKLRQRRLVNHTEYYKMYNEPPSRGRGQGMETSPKKQITIGSPRDTPPNLGALVSANESSSRIRSPPRRHDLWAAADAHDHPRLGTGGGGGGGGGGGSGSTIISGTSAANTISDDVLRNDWSTIKLLEEYNPDSLTTMSQDYAYVADYVVKVDMSVNIVEEMTRYEQRQRNSGLSNFDGYNGYCSGTTSGAMSGPMDETLGRAPHNLKAAAGGPSSPHAGWLERLRDELQSGADIKWYVVVCEDEDRCPRLASPRARRHRVTGSGSSHTSVRTSRIPRKDCIYEDSDLEQQSSERFVLRSLDSRANSHGDRFAGREVLSEVAAHTGARSESRQEAQELHQQQDDEDEDDGEDHDEEDSEFERRRRILQQKLGKPPDHDEQYYNVLDEIDISDEAEVEEEAERESYGNDKRDEVDAAASTSEGLTLPVTMEKSSSAIGTSAAAAAEDDNTASKRRWNSILGLPRPRKRKADPFCGHVRHLSAPAANRCSETLCHALRPTLPATVSTPTQTQTQTKTSKDCWLQSPPPPPRQAAALPSPNSGRSQTSSSPPPLPPMGGILEEDESGDGGEKQPHRASFSCHHQLNSPYRHPHHSYSYSHQPHPHQQHDQQIYPGADGIGEFRCASAMSAIRPRPSAQPPASTTTSTSRYRTSAVSSASGSLLRLRKSLDFDFSRARERLMSTPSKQALKKLFSVGRVKSESYSAS